MFRANSSGRALRIAWAMSSPPCRRAHHRQRELGRVGLRSEFAVIAHSLESLGQIRLPFGKALREHAPRGLGLARVAPPSSVPATAPGELLIRLTPARIIAQRAVSG